MNPGIYYGMSWNDYRAIDLPNPSLLKHGLRSMKRLRRAMNGECQPSSKTVAIGQAVHCMLSGEMDRVAVMPRFELDDDNLTGTGKKSTSKSTSYFKERSSAWETENKGKQVLNDFQMYQAKRAYDVLRANKPADDIIKRSKLEATLIAEVEGVLVKTRMDGLIESEHRGWDLKTCPDVEPVSFYRHAKKLGYWFQFAFHRACLSELGIELQSYDVLALETDNDFDCGVIDVPFALLDVWDGKVRSLLNSFAMARASNDWPGLYPSGRGILQVPNWDMGDDEDVVEWGGVESESNGESEVYF